MAWVFKANRKATTANTELEVYSTAVETFDTPVTICISLNHTVLH